MSQEGRRAWLFIKPCGDFVTYCNIYRRRIQLSVVDNLVDSWPVVAEGRYVGWGVGRVGGGHDTAPP